MEIYDRYMQYLRDLYLAMDGFPLISSDDRHSLHLVGILLRKCDYFLYGVYFGLLNKVVIFCHRLKFVLNFQNYPKNRLLLFANVFMCVH